MLRSAKRCAAVHELWGRSRIEGVAQKGYMPWSMHSLRMPTSDEKLPALVAKALETQTSEH